MMDSLRITWVGLVYGALFAVAGCGGGKGSAATPAPSQGGGVVSASGGASAGGPSGSPGGADSGGTPATTSGVGTAGGPTDQGTAAAAGSGTATGTASAGATPPPDPCAGLIPTPGTPVEIARDISNIPFCHTPTSDGSGTVVAIGIGLHHSGFDLYPMSGGARIATVDVDYQDTGPVYDALVPSAIGFHGAVGTGPGSTVDRGIFTAYDDHGVPLTTAYLGSGSAGLVGDVRLLKLDPLGGGTALMTVSGPLQSMVWNVEIVDAGGHRTAGTALDLVASDLSVATDGHVLVTAQSTADGTAWKARWLDHDTKPLTDWFVFQLTTSPPLYQVDTYVTLEPLADGSIALREGDSWTLVFPNGSARADPAPAWLASRPGRDVAVVRGGKAMALTARSRSGPCGTDSFEVVTPAGTACGNVQLTSAASCARVAFGRDGTAFTLSVGSSPTSIANQLCTYRWWPGLVP